MKWLLVLVLLAMPTSTEIVALEGLNYRLSVVGDQIKTTKEKLVDLEKAQAQLVSQRDGVIADVCSRLGVKSAELQVINGKLEWVTK